jgi:hypothetical protein
MGLAAASAAKSLSALPFFHLGAGRCTGQQIVGGTDAILQKRVEVKRCRTCLPIWDWDGDGEEEEGRRLGWADKKTRASPFGPF